MFSDEKNNPIIKYWENEQVPMAENNQKKARLTQFQKGKSKEFHPLQVFFFYFFLFSIVPNHKQPFARKNRILFAAFMGKVFIWNAYVRMLAFFDSIFVCS